MNSMKRRDRLTDEGANPSSSTKSTLCWPLDDVRIKTVSGTIRSQRRSNGLINRECAFDGDDDIGLHIKNSMKQIER